MPSLLGTGLLTGPDTFSRAQLLLKPPKTKPNVQTALFTTAAQTENTHAILSDVRLAVPRPIYFILAGSHPNATEQNASDNQESTVLSSKFLAYAGYHTSRQGRNDEDKSCELYTARNSQSKVLNHFMFAYVALLLL